MKVVTTCPDDESLVGMLDSQLADDQQQQVTEHFDCCETCQQRLGTLVTHGLRTDLDFEHVGDHLRRAAEKDTTLSLETLQGLTKVLCDQTAAFQHSHWQLSLDFLEPSEDADSLGRLGQYEITEVIGRGGMGIALKGRDTRLDRVVAVKVLAPELASNPTARKRFLREAQAAAAVSHDHVVTTFAVEPAELPYLVMEFIDGQSLQQKIDRDGPLELREILRIGMQTAYGLAAAHAQGLIHRDIKPSNILLQNSVERVQITDFGLARAVDDVTITRTGDVTGTPQYMSPEQAQGLLVDRRADLFSLGSVLYAMCTGRSPFRAESTMAVLHRVCNDSPRPISEVNPDIPAWLTTIIDRLLEKEAEDRFQTAAEVADLLSQCLAHVQQPVVVRLPELVASTRSSRHNRTATRRPKWYVGAILLILVFGSLGLSEATGVTHFSASVISIVRGDGTLVVEVNDPQVSLTIEGEDIVITGAGPKEIRLKPGEYRLQAQRDGKPIPLEQELVNIVRGGRQVVRVTLEQATASDTQTTDYTSVPAEAIKRINRLAAHTDTINSIAISKDGNRLLSGGRDRDVFLWDVNERKMISRFRRRFNVTAVALSPNGKRAGIAYYDGAVRLFDLTGDIVTQPVSPQWERDEHSESVVSLDFSHDGSKLISTSEDETVVVWDTATANVLHEFKCDKHCFSGSVVSRLRDEVLIPQAQGELVLGSLKTGEIVAQFQIPGGCDSLAFAPDEQVIASGHVDGRIHLWRRDDGASISTIEGNKSAVKSLQFTKDARYLLSGGRDKTIRIWSLADHTEIARVEIARMVSAELRITENGRHLFSCGGYVFDPASGKYLADGDYDIHLWQLPESVWPKKNTTVP